jgi:Fe-S cluster assembly protein SufD
MAIESFLNSDKEDPDWYYTPNQFLNKKFKVIDANCLQIQSGVEDTMVLRLSPTENELLCKNLQIVCHSDSKLNLLLICDGGEKMQQVFLYHVKLMENAELKIGIFAKDGKLNKHIFESDLDQSSYLSIFGVGQNTVAGSTEIITKIYHSEPDADSDVYINCLAGKDSRTVFSGTVKIDQGMTDSWTNVQGTSLLIDPTAQCFSLPQLLIDCGAVTATHGCSVGKIDEHSLYYLQSRGFSEAAARKLMIDAFKNEQFQLIQDRELQDELRELFSDQG